MVGPSYKENERLISGEGEKRKNVEKKGRNDIWEQVDNLWVT